MNDLPTIRGAFLCGAVRWTFRCRLQLHGMPPLRRSVGLRRLAARWTLREGPLVLGLRGGSSHPIGACLEVQCVTQA
jgi:hypothetical protein